MASLLGVTLWCGVSLAQTSAYWWLAQGLWPHRLQGCLPEGLPSCPRLELAPRAPSGAVLLADLWLSALPPPVPTTGLTVCVLNVSRWGGPKRERLALLVDREI